MVKLFLILLIITFNEKTKNNLFNFVQFKKINKLISIKLFRFIVFTW